MPTALLQGRTAQRFSSVITLGVLSFNCYAPNDLKIKIGGTDAGGVFKGRRGSASNAYVISTPFDVVDGDDAATAKPTGVSGRSLAIGEYTAAPDNPQRLIITFSSERMVAARRCVMRCVSAAACACLQACWSCHCAIDLLC